MILLQRAAFKRLCPLQMETDLKRYKRRVDEAKAQQGKQSAAEAEEQMSLGGDCDDYDIEVLREQIEGTLIDENLLGVFAPLIVTVCHNPERYSNPLVQQCATLALCKMMCVSASFWYG